MTDDSQATVRKIEESKLSIIDVWMAWIEHLPVPYLVVCLILFVIGVVLFQLIMVAPIGAPFWPIALDSFLNSYLIAYGLSLMLFVRRSARQSLAVFAPVLNLDETGFQQLQANLLRTPTGPTLLASVSVIAISLLANFALGDEQIGTVLLTSPIILPLIIVISLTYGMVGILMYDLIRKLWLISRIYMLGGKFDLFNRRTLYAFSGLTARILAGWLILSYPSALLASGNWRSPAWLTITGLALAVILIAFVYTLLHMHRRMQAEKERLLLDVQSRLHQVFAQLHERMDRGALTDLSQLKVLMDSLIVERDTLTKISTWPWETGTLASFFSVVLVPVGVWFFQTWVKKLLGS